jgi:putative glycosyltransferase (TIGR04372 family)
MKHLHLFKTYPYLFITLPLSLILVLFMVLICPFIKIKIYLVRSHRIGHFAADLELHICEKKELKKNEISIFYFARPICNSQLAKMWKRKLLIFPPFFIRPIDYIIRAIPLLKGFVGTSINMDRDVLNLYDKYPPQLSFTQEEEVHGREGLSKIGISKGSKFVCLIVRDGLYLDPQNEGKIDMKNNYRNSDIHNYLLASEKLTELGYYVIRMGALVQKPLISNNPMIIDYATTGFRTDFMDIYLGAKCSFCITTGTGFDAIPMIFRHPIVSVNYTPIEYFFTSRKEFISIPRHYFSNNLNRKLTIAEILKAGIGTYLKSSDFEKSGVNLIENTPEEICDAVIEMAKRINNTWEPMPEDYYLQDKFWKIFKRYSRFIISDDFGLPIHGQIKARIGSVFLRKNKHLLIDTYIN